jgi:hypothetical protein
VIGSCTVKTQIQIQGEFRNPGRVISFCSHTVLKGVEMNSIIYFHVIILITIESYTLKKSLETDLIL